MADKAIFVSRDPETVQVLLAWHKAQRAWHRKLKKLMKTLDPSGKRTAMVRTGMGRETFVGLSYHGGDISEPWRPYKKGSYTEMIVPRLSTKEGKDIKALMDDCQPPDHPVSGMQGMPRSHWYGLSLCSPGVELREDDGAVYVIWHDPPPTGIDKKLWKRVKLSDYYKVVEREAAA